jgi:hypothetical protein
MVLRRYGRLHHDPDRLAAAPMARYAAPPPATLARPLDSWTPGLYGNDVLPDCTAVSLANAARAFAWTHFGADSVVEDGKPQRFYAQVIGKPDADEAQLSATEGAMVLDVFGLAQSHGVDVGQEIPLVPDFRAFPVSQAGIAWAMARCGCAYLGVDIYLSDENAPTGETWDVSPTQSSLVGAHAVIAYAYAGLAPADLVWIATWGTWQAVTWRWILERTRESYAVAFRQLMPPGPQEAYDALWAAQVGLS